MFIINFQTTIILEDSSSTATCEPCNCDKSGSSSTNCDSKGQCTCKDTFYGLKCSKRDCKMTAWTAWTPECRCGYTDPKHRNRTINIQPLGKGKPCPSTRKETTKCTMTPCDCKKIRPGYYGDRCEKRDCQLANWSSWSDTCACPDCSWNCKDSFPNKRRSRGVKITKVGGGRSCSGSQKESARCEYWCKWWCPSQHIVTCKYKKYKT